MTSYSSVAPFYGPIRNLLRVWVRLTFRPLRVLRSEKKLESGPALLVIHHPFSLPRALALIARLDRRIQLLVERRFLKGWAAGRLAASLGMIPYDYEGKGWPAIVEHVSALAARGETVAVFTRQQPANEDEPEWFAPEAAEIALEAQARLGREFALPVCLVHLFWPVPPSRLEEILIYFDAPITVDLALLNESDFSRQLRAMDHALARAGHRSPFRLHPESVERFLAGLEGVMREDLAEGWHRRPDWKQTVEDFDLSPFLVKLTHQLNDTHPGRLVALSEDLDRYRETKRRAALRRLRAETAGEWFRSRWRRLAAWIETVAGFPVACYGLANLFPAWLVLKFAGRLRKDFWQAGPGEWALRVFVAVGGYAGEVALAAQFLSRSEAGIYAPSLLFSGGYALRYLWLLEHRIPALAHSAFKGKDAERLRELRKTLIDELKLDQDRLANLWNIAH